MLAAIMIAATIGASTPGVLTPQSVRFELVYRTAKVVCPRMSARNLAPTIERLFFETNQVLRGRTHFTGNEFLLLINNCMMYEQGRESS